MESMRILPIMMFLSGMMLMYCGFKNVSPMDVIRGNIGDFQNYEDSDQGYGVTDDPLYAGVPLYHSPHGYRASPGTYY